MRKRSDRSRVAAEQRARPVLERLIDQLHSTCIGPEAGPLLAGSTESSLSFPAPDGQQRDPAARQGRGLALGQHLSQSVFPSTGGEAPNWTFAGTPSSTRVLLTGVGPAQAGDPPIDAPVSVLQVRRRRRRPHLAPDPAQRRQLGARGAGRRHSPSLR